MKKVVIYVILIAIICMGMLFSKARNQGDYEKIKAVKEACEEIASSSYMDALGSNRGQWYVFELEFIHQPTNDAHSRLGEILGEDFETSLSNGDSLFVGFLPYRGSYRIYAGSPTESTMIYPQWNYIKLDPMK